MKLKTMMKIGCFAVIVACALLVLGCGGKKAQSTTTVQRSAGEKIDPLNQTETMNVRVSVAVRGHQQNGSRQAKWLEDRYNVKFEIIPNPGAADANARISLMMADDKERPDILWWNRTMDPDFSRWVNAGLMAELTDWVDKYTVMSDYLNNQDPRSLFFSFGADGKLFRMPGDVPEAGWEVGWIRKDWLDNLGLAVPKTLKELEDVMYAFTYNDPDGNGINDTYGWGGDSGDIRYWWPWMQGSGGGYGHINPDFDFIRLPDGSFGYAGAHEDTRLWVSRVAEQFKKGVITPNSFVAGVNFTEEFNRGYFGAFYRYVSWNNPSSVVNFYANNPGANLIPFDMVAGDNGDPQEDPSNVASSHFFGITKNSSDPERLFALWDDMQSPGYDGPYVMKRNGVQGVDWDFNSDGVFYRIISEAENTEKNYGVNIFADMFNRKDKWNISNTSETVDLFTKVSRNSRRAYNRLVERKDVNSYTVWNRNGPELTDIRNGFLWSVMSGNESIDGWDNYIARLKAAGLDEVLSELTEKMTKQDEDLRVYLESRGVKAENTLFN